MSIVTRRVWRSIGWQGAFRFVLLGVVVAWVFIQGFDNEFVLLLGPILALWSIPRLFLATRGYRKSQATIPYDVALPPLLGSAEEFCLILRPFGSDGEIVLPDYQPKKKARNTRIFVPFQRTLTMEQVIARAAGRALKQKAYALVDECRSLAPPGPVYLRAPREKWQDAATALLRRAHSVIIVLPPGQELRGSFNWEIGQIARYGLRTRTIIILPPRDHDPSAYDHAVEQAAILVTTLENASYGTSAPTDPADTISRYKTMLKAETAFVLKPARDADDSGIRLRRWRLVPPPSKRRRTRQATPIMGAVMYSQAMEAMLTEVEREMAGLSSSARYQENSDAR